MRRAADLFVDCLRAHGVDRIFCVPGESYLQVLDSLADAGDIDVVVCRHEGGAGFMAVADAKLTGRPGVAAVSRGPGATNASIAVHVSQQDAVPLVLLIGQVARHERGRGAFQEIDYTAMFGAFAKGVWEVHDADRLPEVVARAWHAAQSGTPGPAIIVLPEDMLGDETAAQVEAPHPVVRAAPSGPEIDRVMEMLEGAERPLIIAGGMLDSPEGRRALARVAEAHRMPVALSFKHQEIFDNSSPLYAGQLGFKVPRPLIEAMEGADLILAIGTRLGDTPTQGYTFPRAPIPDQPLVHVYPDPGLIGGVYRATLGLACDATAFMEALAERNATPKSEDWAAGVNAVVKKITGYQPREFADGLDFGAMVGPLAEQVQRDNIVTTDAGNFSSWVNCLWRWDGSQQAIGAVAGAMGMGVPGAIAACLRHPARKVICFAGDGGVMMSGNELATAMAKGAKPIVVVSNNGSYGTIRQHQERDHPHRISATELTNPDFAAWGRAFGALGLTVETADQAAEAAAEALAHDGPVVIDVQSSVEGINAFTTIAKLRGEA
ncbi:MAG: thiamine pyrophosphate-binding protein [Paracoccaceae bacterium]|nr:thiamine pyrophosphate-binding protein [Paracoccaceae bacterium]